ncbi:hypothetical protein [Niveispirillum cyanobacteriorum]|uniref:hypothetical protein n=1 Tax=Niveispirillum cyanobacteriorum TaxID=1612173 RepID=UPI001667A9E4|nr:hypothetical protein [Niveispirillum cyanobacteriorum]GGE88978.1 hypothetical protein GCM10011317_52500 [Niveispirillum cyanobacteriorum]
MANRSPSRLGGDLIARKGEAAPVTVSAPPTSPQAPAVALKGTAGTIAVTVRLDPERYERLKLQGVRARRTNQDILVEALDTWLANRDA